MPPKKINVVDMLDRGIFMPPTLAASSATSPPQPLTPGEISTTLLKAVNKVHATDVKLSPLVGVLVAARTPEEIAVAMIKARHKALGGARGVLGAAQSKITICPDGIGYYQHYKKNGSIYWNPSTGAHEVHGAIRQRWATLGWERSFLGYPTTGEKKGRDSASEGFFNHFERGSLYWHPATGAHEVHGAIRQKYLELGAEGSFLGYPTTDETKCPDNKGRFNHFQAGSIYWTPETWAHEVHGLIRNFWAQHGWERNPELGYPLTDELIPHRQLGFVRPPSIRKPIRTLPLDVIRLPDEQPSPTLVALPTALSFAGPHSPVGLSSVSTGTSQPAANPQGMRILSVQPSGNSQPAMALSPMTNRVTLAAARPNPVATQTDQSQNRYSDYENGVLFWRRGAAQAEMLEPRSTAPNGTKIAWSGHEISTIAGTRIRQALNGFPGANIVAINFNGTKPYSFDGAGLHNRTHRVHVTLQGMRRQGFIPIPVHARIEVLVEIGFDPLTNKIIGYLTHWRLLASNGNFLGGGALDRDLHSHLDPALWKQFSLATVAPNKTNPVAVLSVKTKADGNVVVYLEP